MARRLKAETLYAKYLAAMQTALMRGYCDRDNLNKGQAYRFRQMCYHARMLYRERNGGTSPWEDIVITIEPGTWKVRLIHDVNADKLYDPDGNLVNIEEAIAGIRVFHRDEDEPIAIEENDLEMLREVVSDRLGTSKSAVKLRPIPVKKTLDVERILAPEMPAIKPGDDPFGE